MPVVSDNTRGSRHHLGKWYSPARKPWRDDKPHAEPGQLHLSKRSRTSYPRTSAMPSAEIPPAMRPTAPSRAMRPPQGRIFSASTQIAIAAAHATFIRPPTNKRLIKAAQQPRHETP